jgi:cytoskeletal protein RodZ
MQPSQPTGRRGLYMAMGALLVLVVLVAAGLYVPYRAKTRANAVQATPTTTSPAAPTTVSAPPETTNPAATSGSNAGATPSSPENPPPPVNTEVDKKPAVTKKTSSSGSASGSAATMPPEAQASQTTSAPSANDAAELEEAETTVDQLTSRAAAVNDSLDNLRRQQAGQGYGLRGDISSTQEMMKTHLARAQAALQSKDAKGAKKYSDMAEADVEKLEKFLGR